MIFIILILAGLFLWWSLTTKKSNPTFTQVVNDAQKRQANSHHVYKHTFTGMLYAEKEPINDDDKIVYSGTKTQCESYVFRKQNKFL